MNVSRLRFISLLLGWVYRSPTAAMFASRKVEVVGVDVNQRTVDTINRGEITSLNPSSM